MKKINSDLINIKIQQLYAIVKELEHQFPKWHSTPDSHLVGSIGEGLSQVIII